MYSSGGRELQRNRITTEFENYCLAYWVFRIIRTSTISGDGEQYAILHMTGAAISKGLEIIEDLKRDIPNLEIESIERSEVDGE